MYNLLSAREIRKKLRMESMIDVSLQAIHATAQKIGYRERHVGNKVGYHKSIYLALWQHISELLECDKELKEKKAQKQKKEPILGDYHTYNGERDNIDYEWEKNEKYDYAKGKVIIEGPQVINNLGLAIDLIKKQWKSPDDYWYVSILQRKKDNGNVVDKEGKSIFTGGSTKWIDGDFDANRIGYSVIKGNTLEETINSLLNPKVTVFDSWIDFVGAKTIESNDNNMNSIIRVCQSFNARAYMSIYKRSFSEFSSKEIPNDIWTPKVLQQQLKGKTDSSSLERKFDFVSTHKARRNLPFWFIDCDEEDEKINKDVYDYIKNNCGVEPIVYQTHNGFHYLIDMSNSYDEKKDVTTIKDKLNAFLHKIYNNEIVKGAGKQTNPIELEDDKKIILFSDVYIEGRNINYPEWAKDHVYPVSELRPRKIKVNKKIGTKSTPKNPKRVMFIIRSPKDGKEIFKCDGSSKENVANLLRKKFPNWPEENVLKVINNDNFYVTENRITNVELIIKEVLTEFLRKEIIQ